MNLKNGKRLILCALSGALVMTLAGCSHGIGETVKLIENAEAAKQAVEQMSSGGTSSVSVGTVADPYYEPQAKTEARSFSIKYEDAMFTANWEIASTSDTLKIQIFADQDNKGEDGVKIASYDRAQASGSASFQYPLLEDGSYYCYMKVTAIDGSTSVLYTNTTVTVTAESAEGSLSNIKIEIVDGKVVFTWADEEKAHSKFIAMIYHPNDTTNVIADTVVVGTSASIKAPSDLDYVYAAVASYDNNTVGTYCLYKVDLIQHNEVSESTEGEWK